MFNRVYRLEIQSVMLVISTPLVNCYPSTFSLTSPASVWLWEWGGWGFWVLSCVVDHILQEFNAKFLTRFRTYKIATPPQTKTPVKTTFRDCCLYSSFVMLGALSAWHIGWESERVRLSAISIALRGIDGTEETEWESPFKGTVSRDFLLLVFFMNQFAPSHRVFH
jgi:hypothetical protein